MLIYSHECTQWLSYVREKEIVSVQIDRGIEHYKPNKVINHWNFWLWYWLIFLLLSCISFCVHLILLHFILYIQVYIVTVTNVTFVRIFFRFYLIININGYSLISQQNAFLAEPWNDFLSKVLVLVSNHSISWLSIKIWFFVSRNQVHYIRLTS